MASTYTTKRQMIAALLRWHKKKTSGLECEDEEWRLLAKIEKYKLSTNADRRWYYSLTKDKE